MKAIVATSLNGVIARDGKIPWYIQEDLDWLEHEITGKDILLGRTTFLAMPKSLLQRAERVFVVSKSGAGNPPKFIHPHKHCYVHPIAPTDTRPWKDLRLVRLLGGEQTYRAYMHVVSEIHLTLVETLCAGDTCFPWPQQGTWTCEKVFDGRKPNRLHSERPWFPFTRYIFRRKT